ncbi:MAG: cell wall-binding repeat-containing protein [Peptococcaceae bacterium]|nr:cell wall-binding repeat-containing protein [Peptococcaceae bacterium]
MNKKVNLVPLSVILLSIFAFAFALAAFPATVLAASIPTSELILTSDKQQYNVGDILTIDVKSRSEVHIFGVQFTLTYDPAALQLQGGGLQPHGSYTSFGGTRIDDGTGKLTYPLINFTTGPTASMDIGEINFKALKAGTTNLALSDIKAVDADSNMVSANISFQLPTNIVIPVINPPTGDGGGGGNGGGGVPGTQPPERMGGSDRYATAVKIAASYFADGANTVVLTRGDIAADALTAGPLARHYHGPLLLTPKDNLPAQVLTELKNLRTQTVYIVGGVGAVSERVAAEITSQGIKVERVAGADRCDTAYQVAKLLGKVGQVVIVSGTDGAYPDALSISSWAAYNGVPILYANGAASLPDVTAKALAELQVTRTILVGGTGVLPKALENIVPNAERYGGLDRYATNAQVLSKLQPAPTQVFAATGRDFADALAGTAITAQSNAWLILTGGEVNGLAPEQIQILSQVRGSVTGLHIFGGTGAVSEQTLTALKTLLGK